MDQIIPYLWLGGISALRNVEELKFCGIRSVLSVLRGSVTVHPTFRSVQIPLDDVEEEDILSHLVPAISFISAEIEKGHGVLVHCHGGISRSATIVAAYLMYSQGMTTEAALELIRKSRPAVSPNEGFLKQLDIFYQASCSLSNQDKATRMFYLERAVKRIAKGGKPPDSASLSGLPDTSESTSQSPKINSRRRIRCKMCRQELASREHMLGHGLNDMVGSNGDPPVRPAQLLMNIETPLAASGSQASDDLDAMQGAQSDDSVSPSQGIAEVVAVDAVNPRSKNDALPPPAQGHDQNPQTPSSPATSTSQVNVPSQPPLPNMSTRPLSQTHHPSLSAQLYSNPTLAALRTDINTFSRPTPLNVAASPPILADSKCSGYFVEPIKWMDPFLQSGQLSGKIVCPNKRCGAKLGNYDWAGVHCSCKEWVVPGFCIHRSKVDEYTVQ